MTLNSACVNSSQFCTSGATTLPVVSERPLTNRMPDSAKSARVCACDARVGSAKPILVSLPLRTSLMSDGDGSL